MAEAWLDWLRLDEEVEWRDERGERVRKDNVVFYVFAGKKIKNKTDDSNMRRVGGERGTKCE
jgi:hypothetical protein